MAELFTTRNYGTIRVISGLRGAGKTTRCQALIEHARGSGVRVAGLVSPGRYVANGIRNGIFALDLVSQETRLLANLIKGELKGYPFGHWKFDSSVFEWGNQILENIAETDLLVIDELGYLEFNFNGGWKASFDVLSKKNTGWQCLSSGTNASMLLLN